MRAASRTDLPPRVQVLENYHAARLFDIAGAPERDALRAFPGAQYGELRRMVIEFVLGTDVSRHRGLLEDTLRAVGPGEGRECASGVFRMRAPLVPLLSSGPVGCSTSCKSTPVATVERLHVRTLIFLFYVFVFDKVGRNLEASNA